MQLSYSCNLIQGNRDVQGEMEATEGGLEHQIWRLWRTGADHTGVLWTHVNRMGRFICLLVGSQVWSVG